MMEATEPPTVKNPKDALGSDRIDLSLVEPAALVEEALAMTEGLCKYGRTNYLGTNVVAMIYAGAALRHLWKWIGGEECDPKTKVPHLGSVRACCGIIIAARVQGTLIDNRPLRHKGLTEYIDSAERIVTHLKQMFKDKKPHHFTITD